jgi:hypothetical protein
MLERMSALPHASQGHHPEPTPIVLPSNSETQTACVARVHLYGIRITVDYSGIDRSMEEQGQPRPCGNSQEPEEDNNNKSG